MEHSFSTIKNGSNPDDGAQRPDAPSPDSPPNAKRARLAQQDSAPNTCPKCKRPEALAGSTAAAAGGEPYSEDVCTGPHPSQEIGPEDPHHYCLHGCYVNNHFPGETPPKPESWWCCHSKVHWGLCEGCAGKNISQQWHCRYSSPPLPQARAPQKTRWGTPARCSAMIPRTRPQCRHSKGLTRTRDSL